MSESAEVVHVVFSLSAAATLHTALSLLGIAERVIGLADGLSVGPIDPRDPNARRAWAHSTLRAGCISQDGLDRELAGWEQAWSAVTAPGIDPVFWVCLSSPAEHACFLAFAARMRDRSFDIVDATDLDVTSVDGTRSPRCLGMMRVQDVVASGLYARRRPLSAGEHRAASKAWSQLQRENAPFRIVWDGRLVSAPLTHYDALLVELAGQDWEIAARLIGRAFDRLSSSNALIGQGTSDAVLFGRLLALGENGTLEVVGPGLSMRDTHVRRSSDHRSA